MGKSCKTSPSSVGFVIALIAIALVITFWQWILLGIILCVLFRSLWKAYVSKDADPSPNQKMQRPASGPVRTQRVPNRVLESAARPGPRPGPMPGHELPAPDYLPRWSTTRRFYTDREHDAWQREFDSVPS